jgi:hypothetical protein
MVSLLPLRPRWWAFLFCRETAVPHPSRDFFVKQVKECGLPEIKIGRLPDDVMDFINWQSGNLNMTTEDYLTQFIAQTFADRRKQAGVVVPFTRRKGDETK